MICRNAAEGTPETIAASAEGAEELQLRLSVDSGVARFSYSADRGQTFHPIGDQATLREGRWMGAKFGLVVTRRGAGRRGGYADVDWVHVDGRQ